jgi:hypothetical protein
MPLAGAAHKGFTQAHPRPFEPAADEAVFHPSPPRKRRGIPDCDISRRFRGGLK